MITVPISLGELIDKITILNIKLSEITDEHKLKNVHTELDLLISLPQYQKVKDNPDVIECTEKLYSVNSKLWQIEDEIRDHERQKRFDQDFISLARAVYITNDERSQLKKDINVKYGSQIIEEKSYSAY